MGLTNLFDAVSSNAPHWMFLPDEDYRRIANKGVRPKNFEAVVHNFRWPARLQEGDVVVFKNIYHSSKKDSIICKIKEVIEQSDNLLHLRVEENKDMVGSEPTPTHDNDTAIIPDLQSGLLNGEIRIELQIGDRTGTAFLSEEYLTWLLREVKRKKEEEKKKELEKLWADNEIQFARLISVLDDAGLFDSNRYQFRTDASQTMHVSPNGFRQLLDRARRAWAAYAPQYKEMDGTTTNVELSGVKHLRMCTACKFHNPSNATHCAACTTSLE